jgi:selenocysteine-specific elongation factor
MQVVATAGHVDHGKSTLVRALTGMEPDRWEEERRRGLTIDLGFAWMSLPGGPRLAFVDVPGHERFVPNMLAGLGPVPAVLMVVAADGGWMPQSAEHLAAIDALGISRGVLAVTRADLADPEPALRQAAAEIAATSLGPVEAVAVSAVTGAGMTRLREALTRLAGALPAPDPDAPVRLWVDRAFSIKGSGTVVTGTLAAGTVRTGDELLLTPSMRPVRVRAIESLQESADRAGGVARVALNLRGVAREIPARGMALVQPGGWTLTSVTDVRLAPPRVPGPGGSRGPGGPAGARPQASAAGRLPRELIVHVGSARTPARVRVLGPGRDADPAGAAGPAGDDGAAVIARLTLRDPLPLHVGDRVLLRDPGSAEPVILGATVLDVVPPDLRRRGAATAAARELAAWPDPPAAADLLRRHGLLRTGALTAMGAAGCPPPVAGDWVADPGYWDQAGQRLASAGTGHAKREPLAPGMPVEAARAAVGLPDRRLAEALALGARAEGPRAGAGAAGTGAAGTGAARGRAAGAGGAGPLAGPPGTAPPVILEGGYLRPAPAGPADGHRDDPDSNGRPAGEPAPPPVPEPLMRAVRAIRSDLAGEPFRAPEAGRLQELGLDARAIAAAARAGLLLRISEQVVLAPGADADAAAALATLPQPFTTAEARKALGTTRRVAIPLLEFLDRARITERLPDDRRRLRPR